MIGTVEFNSATLYRYAAVDVDLLRRNLGTGLREDELVTEPVRSAVEAFVQGFITSLPTGKINTFGNHTLPDAVVVKCATPAPISLVAAFEEPARPPGERRATCGRPREAPRFLSSSRSSAVYGSLEPNLPAWVLHVGKSTEALDRSGRQPCTMPGLVSVSRHRGRRGG